MIDYVMNNSDNDVADGQDCNVDDNKKHDIYSGMCQGHRTFETSDDNVELNSRRGRGSNNKNNKNNRNNQSDNMSDISNCSNTNQKNVTDNNRNKSNKESFLPSMERIIVQHNDNAVLLTPELPSGEDIDEKDDIDKKCTREDSREVRNIRRSLSGALLQSTFWRSFSRNSGKSLSSSLQEDFYDDIEEEENDEENNRTSDPNNRNQSKKIKRQRAIARREDIAIRRLKIIFVGLLLLTTIVASILVYRNFHEKEMEEYNIQFDYIAHQIVDKLHINARTKMEAISALALNVQAYALNTNHSWPFVTIPFFEHHVASVKSLTGAFGVQLFPIVTSRTRQHWENYTIHNNWWINASFDEQLDLYNFTLRKPTLSPNKTTWFDELWGQNYSQVPNLTRPDFELANGMASQVFTTVHPKDGPYNASKDPYVVQQKPNTYYFPQWQVAPMSWYYQSTINSDYGQFQDFRQCTNISITFGQACLGTAWTDFNSPGYITTMLYPIFNTVSRSQQIDLNKHNFTSTEAETNNATSVVAFLGVDIFWKSYLEGVLAPSSKKVFVVVNSTCGDSFTMALNGTDVIPLDSANVQNADVEEMRTLTETLHRSSLLSMTTRFGHQLYAANKHQMQAKTASSSPSMDVMASYIGLSLHEGYCQYDFTVYPSSELKDIYVTNRPQIFTAVVCFIFCFMVIIFVLYDYLVERRQRLVTRLAVLSDSIVSSLFPSSVKDQLYVEQQERRNNDEINVIKQGSSMHPRLSKPAAFGLLNRFSANVDSISPWTNPTVTSITCHDESTTKRDHDRTHDIAETFTTTATSNSTNHVALNNTQCVIETGSIWKHGDDLDPSTCSATLYRGLKTDADVTNIASLPSRPIANLYPDTTIMFADLVGFTKWSSGRAPCDVFLLLETLYSAFDSIAIRRHVFKVETIGDCYVAVTGLPDPQHNHALIMTRFADEIQRRLLLEINKTIAPSLGTESLDLAMRVGLNSGPVIAGVLRGDKARFQLFGDTMNTAARMESNGQRDRIHASQSTADLLIAEGKNHWLKAREDVIEAKGKGKMQTYWVSVKRTRVRRLSTCARRGTTNVSFKQSIEKLSDLEEFATLLIDENDDCDATSIHDDCDATSIQSTTCSNLNETSTVEQIEFFDELEK